MEVFRSEIKVGVLMLVAAVLLGAGIIIASDVKTLFDHRRTLTLLFPYADGITKGSPVWYAGLEVGEVSDIHIAEKTPDRIAVAVKMDPRAQVRKDSHIDIRSLGMMGAKYVEISPGSIESPEVKPGEVLEGQSPASLSQILETGQLVATRLVNLVQETQSLIHEVRTESSIKETIQNSNALLVELRDVGRDLKPVIEKASEFADSLKSAGSNLQQTTGEGGKELTAFLKDLRETNHSLQRKIDGIESQLTKTLTQAEKGLLEAEGLVKGAKSVVTSNEQDLAALLKYLKETSRHLEALSSDLRAHPWKVIWKKDGTHDQAMPTGTDQWREKERIGPHGKE
jgi:phospholipid/cholesterol/gamma-HCH transport system substrate-binding protein